MEEKIKLRDKLADIALQWQASFGVAPSITSSISEYDAAMLVGMSEKEYSDYMRDKTAVAKVAIEVNISIMRAFVLMRQMVIGYEELLKRIEELEVSTDVQFNELYQALTQLLSQSKQQKERRPVGFVTYNRSKNE